MAQKLLAACCSTCAKCNQSPRPCRNCGYCRNCASIRKFLPKRGFSLVGPHTLAFKFEGDQAQPLDDGPLAQLNQDLQLFCEKYPEAESNTECLLALSEIYAKHGCTALELLAGEESLDVCTRLKSVSTQSINPQYLMARAKQAGFDDFVVGLSERALSSTPALG